MKSTVRAIFGKGEYGRAGRGNSAANLRARMVRGGCARNFAKINEGDKINNLVHCDRCYQNVEGFLPDEGGMSAGVYVGWTEFFNRGERVICDQCMWADSRYRAIYGIHK